MTDYSVISGSVDFKEDGRDLHNVEKKSEVIKSSLQLIATVEDSVYGPQQGQGCGMIDLKTYICNCWETD